MLAGYRREVLPNGLRVVAVQNPALHSFVCSTCVHAGPRFERPDETGLTHFVEHMLIQGSRSFPTFNDIVRRVEDLGGIVEGQTYPEYVRVTFGVHRKHWRRVMEIAGDVLANPLFDPEEVEQEKSIITQEISRHRDRAGRNISVYELCYGMLLRERVSEAGTRGSPAILSSFDAEAVRAQYERFFLPDNMVVSVAGGFDFDEVLGEMGRYFAEIPPGDNLPELLPRDLTDSRPRAVFRDSEALPVVEALLCNEAYPLGDERTDAVRAVARLLGGGLSSRLFSRVREELGLVYDVEAYPQAFSDVGALLTSFSVGVENLTDALEVVTEEIRRTAAANFTGHELRRYQESAKCGMEMLCDHPSSLADWFGRQELLLGEDQVITPEEYIRRQEALTLGDLARVLEEVFTPERSRLAVVGPFGENELEAMRALFPAEEPEVAAPAGA
ncbi:MAG: pitrilysin family protein [Candidatus Brocadiia bacterium]